VPKTNSRMVRPLKGAVPVEVVAIVVLAVHKQPVPIPVEARADVGGLLEPGRGVGILQLATLHDVLGVRKVAAGPRVVEV
jgi:hypothetical protein